MAKATKASLREREREEREAIDVGVQTFVGGGACRGENTKVHRAILTPGSNHTLGLGVNY